MPERRSRKPTSRNCPRFSGIPVPELLKSLSANYRNWCPGFTETRIEPEAGNDAQLSLQAGKVVRIPAPATIADGARNQHIGALILPILRSHVERIVTVTDDQLRKQMRFFVEHMKLVAEPTGCLAAAAMMSGLIDISGSRVGVLEAVRD